LGEEFFDGPLHLGHEGATPGQKNEIHILGPEFGALEGVGDRGKDGKSEDIIRFPGVHHFQVEKWLEDFLHCAALSSGWARR